MRRVHVVVLAGLIASVGLGRAPADGQTGGTPGHPPGARGLVWTAPATWKEEPPSSTMRRAQYRIPGPGGDGECVVFYFGPGQGGDAQPNIARWAGQFRTADDKPAGAAFKTNKIRVGNLAVTLAEVSGTYVGGMGGGSTGPPRPNQMMLAAIVEGPDANWFFRALGPKTTMESQRAAFDQMIRSIKRGHTL